MRNSKINKLTLRERMIAVAKKIKWIPEFGLERELDWLKNMDDWLISKKNRYWGLALPIYECKKCKHFEVIGSKDELRKRAISGWEKFDGRSPHKPYIDEVKIKCQKCGNEVCRINDVGNPWLDAGIVPYSTIAENNQGKPLYQTDRKGWQQWFPADLITESFPGQFKNWFYAQIAMSTVLENTNPFKTVLGYATLTGEDGRPMHKSWGNMIEFNVGADKIGVDVMRWMYCRQTPSDNLPFGYKKADEVRRQFYLMLWNVYKFFVEYASLDKATKIFSQDQLASRRKPGPLAPCSSSESEGSLRRSLAQTTDFRKNFVSLSKSILDKWLINRFNWLVDFVEKSLKDYNIKDAALEIERFVNDLSLWYIRRSRDRVWVNSDDEKDKQAFYQTTYYVLVNLAIILSPFLPFISEEIYTNLTGKESVHLTDWPKISSKFKIQSSKLFNDMDLVRKIAEAGRRSRKELKLKLRQPLKEVSVELPKTVRFLETKNQSQYEQLLKEELNVKKIVFKTTGKGKEILVGFDTKLTKELIEEGELRGLVREIQAGRKELGIRPDQKISLTIPKKFSQSVDYLKKKTVCGKINFGAPVKIEL